ncbi:MAG: HD domain-containing phosphohydrolase, partial [Pseudomonadota bacterium]
MAKAESTTTVAQDVSTLLSSTTMPRAPRSRMYRMLLVVLGAIILIAGLISVARFILEERAETVLSTLEQRLETLAGSRVELVESWINGTTRLAVPLVNNDLFRLFVTETAIAGQDDPLAAQLSDQGPYMIEVLSEFVQQNGMRGAHLVNGSGRSQMSSAGAVALLPEQSETARQVLRAGSLTYGSLRANGEELELDIYYPVRAAQAIPPKTEPDVVGVLMVTAPATAAIGEFVANRQLNEPGESTSLLFLDSDAELSVLTRRQPNSPQSVDRPIEIASGIPFGDRQSVSGSGQVFSFGQPVPGISWMIVQEKTNVSAIAPLNEARRAILTVVVLFLLVFLGAFAAIWFLESAAHNRTLAAQYRDLAEHISQQKQVLDSVTGSISEHIGLKRPDGVYAYVNPAFARSIGRAPADVEGMKDSDLYPRSLAQRLAESDRSCLADNKAVTVSEHMVIGGKERFFEISKVPLLLGKNEELGGIVSVARDVTEVVEQRRRREAMLRQSIEALVRTIEFSDPYLAGHSRLVRNLAVLIGDGLKIRADDLATLEIAANVAQIGKIFVPRDLLTKPGRLTEKENEVMQSHVLFASRILREIDFELPVHEAVTQMYERLDGSGYPAGRKSDDICQNAR